MDYKLYFSDEAQEILRRLDILAEYRAIGFHPLPGADPDAAGWIEGNPLYNPGWRAFVNVGHGPERGSYFEKAIAPAHSPVRGASGNGTHGTGATGRH